jgi:hypothetical protein
LYDNYSQINDEFLLEASRDPNFYPKVVLGEDLMLSRKQYIENVLQSGESARIENEKKVPYECEEL